MMKKLLYTLVIFFASTCLYAQNASKLMREGLLDYKNGNFADAITKYKLAIKNGADRNLANYNLGATYYKAGKPDSALMYWQTVATTDKDKALQARAWHNIGNSFVKQGNFEKAADAYKQALKLNPNDEDTRYNLAYTQRKLQQQPPPPQQGEPKEEEQELDKNQSENILEALDNKEKNLHKKKAGGPPSSADKDW